MPEDAKTSRPRASSPAPKASPAKGEEKKPAAKGVASMLGSLPFLFFTWYLSSVFCTTISKILVRDIFPSAYWLTFTQFIVAAIVGYFVVLAMDGRQPTPVPLFTEMFKEFMTLAGVFAFGMVALNKGYENMHVSLVETLRAVEPVVSVTLTALLMPGEMPTIAQRVCLIPIVAGACMSSYGSTDFTIVGFLWVMGSNVCFCLRTIQYKQASRKHKMNDWNLFFHICKFGILFQFLFGIIGDPAGLGKMAGSFPSGDIMSLLSFEKLRLGVLIFLNGVFYYTYLQFSWVILMKVAVVTHAVGNCMRRPVVLICNVMYFRNPVNLINGIGILCAFIGVLLYTSIKPLLASRKPEEKKK